MTEAGTVKCGLPGADIVSRRLATAITELRGLQKLLLSGEGLDPRILTDFRDALNHVRNTAWSAQQYIASQATNQDPASVLCVLAGERVRVAYQLCQAIESDLKNTDIQFQTGQLIQLYSAASALTDQLGNVVGKPE